MIRVACRLLVGMCKVNDVINRKSRKDTNHNGFDRAQTPTQHDRCTNHANQHAHDAKGCNESDWLEHDRE